MAEEPIRKLKTLLDSILGEPKQSLDDSCQLEYPCPCCIQKYGIGEATKYNLSISLRKLKMQCWKCANEGENTKGSVLKIIRDYGSDSDVSEYRRIVSEMYDSGLYELPKGKSDIPATREIELPKGYFRINEKTPPTMKPLKYLTNRGLDLDTIMRFKIGYTAYDYDDFKNSMRIIIPSYDNGGSLNYWIGRDYSNNPKRFKYNNPDSSIVKKTDIIFNEWLIEWDATVTLVEGVFDHMVTPNSIPLLGKSIKEGGVIYNAVTRKANANVNIFLDGDARESAINIYRTLNHGRLLGKIRMISLDGIWDPSLVFEKLGKKGIIKCLASARRENIL